MTTINESDESRTDSSDSNEECNVAPTGINFSRKGYDNKLQQANGQVDISFTGDSPLSAHKVHINFGHQAINDEEEEKLMHEMVGRTSNPVHMKRSKIASS